MSVETTTKSPLKPARPEQWLILRGLVRDGRHWLEFKERFQKGVGAPVHTLDAPGLGTEADRDCPKTIDAIMEDFRARFVKLREAHPGTWGVMAVSLGGMVTLRWLERYPGDFSVAVIQSTSARDVCSVFERITPAALRFAFQLATMSKAYDRELMQTGFVMSKKATLEQREKIARAWEPFALPIRRFRKVAWSQLRAASKFRAPQEPFKVPLMMINSLGDQMVNPVCTERLARRYGAPLATHSWGGHDLALEDPDWIIRSIDRWLSA